MAKGFVTFWEGRCEYFALKKTTAPCIFKLHPPAKFQVRSHYQFRNNFRTDKQKTNNCVLIYKITIDGYTTNKPYFLSTLSQLHPEGVHKRDNSIPMTSHTPPNFYPSTQVDYIHTLEMGYIITGK